jgi:alginate O-acetyltransferase complex protein AlgI
MADVGAARAPDAALRLLLSNEALAALAFGAIFALPVMPWLGERLRLPRLPVETHLPARLDPHGAHVISVAVLTCALVLSVAKLAGSSLNPFLYFRF